MNVVEKSEGMLERGSDKLNERTKRARKQLKNRIARLQKHWWVKSLLREIESGDNYKASIDQYTRMLRKTGRRAGPAAVGAKLTATEINEHDDRLPKEK